MFGFKGKGSKREVARGGDKVRQPRLMEGQEAYTFRRSRTLTGSLSSKVTSSGAKRPDLKSDRVKLHELHRHRRLLKSSLGTLLVLLLITGFFISNSILFASKQFVAASTVPPENRQALEAAITAYVNRYPAQAFLVSLDEQRLTQFMQAAYPEVASIAVKDAWSIDGVITVKFRTPIAVWQIGGDRFYVDSQGVAFTSQYGSEPKLKVEDVSGYTPEAALESSVASQRFIGYLGQLLGALDAQGVGTVDRVVIPPLVRQLNIFMKGRPYPLYTHIDRDPYAQAADMKSALRFFDQRKLSPEYVDVRVEGKAFYR